MKRLITILIICFSLSGCALWNSKPDAVITENVVHVDPRVLQPCSDLILAAGASLEDVLSASVSNAELYLDCRRKQDASIKLIKEFANIKDKKP